MVNDKRSGKLALVAHCIINQNSRLLGLAERSSIITEIAEFLLHNEMGIIQMPCPELTYAGLLRRAQTRDQYDTAMFRRHCKRIVKEIVNQIQEYEKCGIKVKIVIGVDGSPSCGVNKTSRGDPCKNTLTHESMKCSGVLMEELSIALKKRNFSIPFYGIHYERLPEDLAKIEKLVKD